MNFFLHMNATSKLSELQKQMIQLLCSNTVPSGVLPHTVFVEEVDNEGNPTYTKCSLVSINREKQTCVLSNLRRNEETFNLSDINIDWLAAVLDRCNELKFQKEREFPEPDSKKELWAFLFPFKRFQRNTPDSKILTDYEKLNTDGPEVEKLTPDELAERINDDMFNDQEYYIRFIELPKTV